MNVDSYDDLPTLVPQRDIYLIVNIVAYLLKSRSVEPDKQLFLGNGCVTSNDGITVGKDVFCAVRVEDIN
jgi:hypothetical protein